MHTEYQRFKWFKEKWTFKVIYMKRVLIEMAQSIIVTN